MNLSPAQHRLLCAIRGAVAGSGGVLVLGGGLAVFFAVGSSFGWWLGWGMVACGVFALLMGAAMYCVPGFLLPEHRRKESSGGRRKAA
ncbi:MAG TPA: hypothetical protein VLA96_13435 [Terriglobales bacterium]|nr:hypothetical protein [Terriglobales bacterium]